MVLGHRAAVIEGFAVHVDSVSTKVYQTVFVPCGSVSTGEALKMQAGKVEDTHKEVLIKRWRYLRDAVMLKFLEKSRLWAFLEPLMGSSLSIL